MSFSFINMGDRGEVDMRGRNIYDGQPNMDGRRRQDEHILYDDVNYGMQLSDFIPFDILGSISKTMHGAGIKTFCLVDGVAAFLNHVGLIMMYRGQLVVSEANYPEHAYTPVVDYLAAQRRDECRLTLMRIDPIVWDGNLQYQLQGRRECLQYHHTLKGRKYTPEIFLPMAAYSLMRNFTPFVRGRYIGIPPKELDDVFQCSHEIDVGFRPSQELTNKDWFPSSLHKFITTPMDIWAGPYTRFVSGWKRERIK